MKKMIKEILKRNLFLILIMISLSVIVGILSAIPTALLEKVFSEEAKDYLPIYIGVVAAFLILNHAAFFAKINFMYKVIDTIESIFVHKIVHLTNQAYQELGNGTLMNCRNNAYALGAQFVMINSIILEVTSIITIGVVILRKAPIVMAPIGVVSVIISIFYVVSKRRRKQIQKKVQVLNVEQLKLFSDISNNNTTVRVYNGQNSTLAKYSKGRDVLTAATKSKQAISVSINTVINAMTYIIPIALICYNIIYDTHQYASCLIMVMYIGQLLNPIITIIDTVVSMTSETTSLFDNINKVINAESEKDEGKITLSSINEGIELKNVIFKYDDSDLILNGINMKIQKGQNIGIVGPSGAGKSSLIKLFNRVNEVTDGQILIDGIPINELTLKSLRAKVGVVSQRSECFDDTVMNNIRYGRPSATDEEVQRAAELANCTEFISKMPNGYNTNIGPSGTKLSGGQQQRINIARLFLLDPEVLILDEATSSLDNKSERLIKDAIERLSGNRTVISIAHRLTTIQNCDKIYVINNHKVESSGTYDELLESSHTFRELACADE